MKNLLIRTLCLMIIIAIPVSSAYAQRVEDNTSDADIGPIFVKLDRMGKAKTAIKIPANKRQKFAINGKTFKNLEVKQLKGAKLKYELYKGKKRLSTGYTTDAKINIKSDGRSSYYLSVIADDLVVNLTLEWKDRRR